MPNRSTLRLSTLFRVISSSGLILRAAHSFPALKGGVLAPPNVSNRVKGWLTAALMLFCAGCTTIYNPATGKNESLLYDTPGEVALGKDMDKEIRRELHVFDDSSDTKRLQRIGKKIAAASDRQDLEYSYNVVRDEEFNAFAIPGGFVYVNSGLIEAATDDELACVIAHETGHIAARHSVKKLQGVLPFQIGLIVASGLGADAGALKAVDFVFSDIIVNGYSRKDEFLADTLSVRYAKRAGYNPQGMISFFRKLQDENKKKGRSEPLVFLSSHPPIEERIKNVQREIALEN